MLLNLAYLAAIGLLLGALLITLVILAAKNPYLFLLILLTYLSLNSSTFPWLNNIPAITFASFNIYPLDLFSAGALLSVATKVNIKNPAINMKRLNQLKFCMKLLLFEIVVGISFWALTYGLQTGINSWRELLYMNIFLMYSLTMHFSWTAAKLRVLMVVPGSLLGIVTAFKFIVSGVGRSNGINPMTGESLGRATTSLVAYFILVAGLASVYLLKENPYLSLVYFINLYYG